MDKLKHFIDAGNSNKSDHNTKKNKIKKTLLITLG